MPHIIGSSNWPCIVDSTRSSDEVNSTNLVQHSASSEWPFLSHYFHWAYYFQFPTLFWTKFKRDELPGFARYRSLLLKTLKSSAHKLTLKLRDINFISEPLHICICIPSDGQLNGKEAHLRFLGYQVVSLPLGVYKFKFSVAFKYFPFFKYGQQF